MIKQNNSIDSNFFIIFGYTLKEHTHYNHNSSILQKKDDFFKPSIYELIIF